MLHIHIYIRVLEDTFVTQSMEIYGHALPRWKATTSVPRSHMILGLWFGAFVCLQAISQEMVANSRKPSRLAVGQLLEVCSIICLIISG